MAGHSRSKNGVLSHAYAPAIREERDQTRFTGPRTGSAGDGPILFHGPDPQCSLYIPNRRSRPFSRRAPPSMPTAQWRAMPACSAKSTTRATMVMRGAFADTLASRGIRRIPMLFQHDPSEPVGIWLELREDFRGLFARGRLIPEVARGRELISLLRAGAIDGLSIGFRASKARIDPKTRIRRLHAVDLWEISIVTFPLLAGARVRAVKHATSQAKPSCTRTRAEREWVKTTTVPRRP